MQNRIFLFLLIVFALPAAYGQDYIDKGLSFSSYEVNQDKRTSLNLTPNKPIQLDEKFSLEFQANFRNEKGVYGNIFKIIGNDKLNIDLVCNLRKTNRNFWLVVKDTILFQYKWSDIPKSGYDKWMKFKIEVDLKNSSLTMSINGNDITKNYPAINELDKFDFSFGKSLHKDFSTTDVSPMSIKYVKIFDGNNNPIRDWDLGKHTINNKLYDNISNEVAYAENPTWLIDEHVFWKKNDSFTFDNLLGSAIDKVNNRIFFVDSKAVYIYSLNNKTIDTLTYNKNALKCQSNSFIYNSYKNELVAYSIDKNFYKIFDFNTLEWSDSDEDCTETGYLHHNKMISPKDSTLLTFGGYGYYNYKASVKKFDLKSPELNHHELDKDISSRYLSSSGVFDSNKFLIFAGYGSPSGEQDIDSQHYYDLYTVNFDGLKVKKLWDVDNAVSNPYVPVQSMVVNNNSDNFYTLIYNNTIYNTTLKLARFGINEYKKTVYPDSIPYEFLDVKSNADFFLNSEKSKLYTITLLENKANLFSLTYPPLFTDDIYQEEIVSTVNSKYYWLILPIAGLLVLIPVFILRNKKTKNDVNIEHTAKKELLDLSHAKTEKIKTSAIYLFDGFQVYDKTGNDITALFTPTLKQLFLVVLLSGIKNGKGILSNKLTDLLWPNKSESNARNNRNVNISKLRLVLDKIGDIDISNENTYWNIVIGETVFCDYVFVNDLLKQSTSSRLEKEQIYQILDIVSGGEITPDIQDEWIYDFRTDITNLLIDDLNRFAKTQTDLQLLVLIANTILKYGILNEEAIALKCKSLYALGKKGSAKQSYNQFCTEYFNLLDANYDKSFKDLINS